MEISSVLHFLLTVHLIFSRTAGNGQKNLVVTQPEIITAKAGGSVTITCSFMSQSLVYSATWTLGCSGNVTLQDHPSFQQRVYISRSDAVQTPNNTQVPNYEMKTTIIIHNLTENDSGTFCCHIKTAIVEAAGTGPGTRLEVTPRSFPAESINKMLLVVEIIHIAGLIILIVLLGIAVKTSC